MRKYGYLVVEGPHDVAFCVRLLKTYGLEAIRLIDELDKTFKPIIPVNFPHKGDLLKRMPVPTFLQSQTHAIAIQSAVGDSALISALELDLEIIDQRIFSGIGFMLDADSAASAKVRRDDLRREAKEKIKLEIPESPSAADEKKPRTGIFVLPDNQSQGTLEDILIQSADIHYPEILAAANTYITTTFDGGLIPKSHRKDINKPAGKKKATIGAMASLFKPGKAVQMSIQDQDWLTGDTLKLPCVQAVLTFLETLFELTPPAAAAPAQPENAA